MTRRNVPEETVVERSFTLEPRLPLREQTVGPRDEPWLRDRVIVLANRAPFRHEYAADGRVTSRRSGGGLVTALEPLMAQCRGTWVAHGAGAADRRVVDLSDSVRVSLPSASYRLRYVWLEPTLVDGFYHGFANEGLWPLCHAVGVSPVFRPDDYRLYEIANARFASAVAQEAKGAAPLVLVQDYHFALAPAMVRRLLPGSRIVAFWHIPWPSPATLRACPFAEEILKGVLASDVVGVQTDGDAENLLSCAELVSRLQVDRSARTIRVRERVVRVHVWPVGVDANHPALLAAPPPLECRTRVCADLGAAPSVHLGVGVDRLDYTKGLTHKLRAIERMLQVHPALRGRLTFVQVASPSRDCLQAYRATRAELLDTSARINARFGTAGYQPVHLLETHHDADAVYRLYRAADVCVVSSLRDGMNLVAKEFVSARDDERGALVLSQFAGAAQQMSAALLIDPFDVEQSAGAIARALAMAPAEQARRMRRLRQSVRMYDATWWARQITSMPPNQPMVGSVDEVHAAEPLTA